MKNENINTATAHEIMIPAAIGIAAMELIMDGATTEGIDPDNGYKLGPVAMSIEDAVFLSALESSNACYDKAFAKTYGLANWAKLSFKNHGFWDHCFGRENRLPGFLTRDMSKAYAIEDKILARQEERYGD